MLIAIDGTGDSYLRTGSWTDADIRRSFVHKMYEASPDPDKRYIGGPDVLGTLSHWLFDEAMEFHKARTVTRGKVVNLIGYSRGAYIAMCVASALNTQGVPVNFLGLFDAVNRQDLVGVGGIGVDTDVVPGNVRVCAHARRDPSVGSRVLFFNTGLSAAPGVDFYLQTFRATHSGMGGMPMEGDQPDGQTPLQEREESRRAGRWMMHHAMKHGVIRTVPV